MFDPLSGSVLTAEARRERAREVLPKLVDKLGGIRSRDARSAEFVSQMIDRLFDPVNDGGGFCSEAQLKWLEDLHGVYVEGKPDPRARKRPPGRHQRRYP